MTTDTVERQSNRTETGIRGVETVTRGGLPSKRLTLVAGTSGTGKTIFGAHFLVAGIDAFDEPGVFVSLDQRTEDLLANLSGLGWDLPSKLEDGSLTIIDGTPDPEGEDIVTGAHDLSGLLVRIRHAIETTGARRLVIDAVNLLAGEPPDGSRVRRILHRVSRLAAELEVTTVVTSERLSEEEPRLTRFGLESFAADAVIVLRNTMEGDARRRTFEVVKLRGGTHETGKSPYAIIPGEGFRVLPLSSTPLTHPPLGSPISTGVSGLDDMLSGGIPKHAVALVAGPSGTGKTLLSCAFANACLASGDRVLYVTYDESRDQLLSNAAGVGLDLQAAASGENPRLRVISTYPESRTIVEHLLDIERSVETFEPSLLVVDGISSLAEQVAPRVFREFLIGLGSLVKSRGMSGWFTTAIPLFYEQGALSSVHLSAVADTLILLRFREIQGATMRALAVLKSRGASHDPFIRELVIGSAGLHVGRKLDGGSFESLGRSMEQGSSG